ncbi:MAG TPA: hypothetical protein VEA41_07335 [Salinarimonas sp.]|nr:hypothetical protein [Salinarimonas sp.]
MTPEDRDLVIHWLEFAFVKAETTEDAFEIDELLSRLRTNEK